MELNMFDKFLLSLSETGIIIFIAVTIIAIAIVGYLARNRHVFKAKKKRHLGEQFNKSWMIEKEYRETCNYEKQGLFASYR